MEITPIDQEAYEMTYIGGYAFYRDPQWIWISVYRVTMHGKIPFDGFMLACAGLGGNKNKDFPSLVFQQLEKEYASPPKYIKPLDELTYFKGAEILMVQNIHIGKLRYCVGLAMPADTILFEGWKQGWK